VVIASGNWDLNQDRNPVIPWRDVEEVGWWWGVCVCVDWFGRWNEEWECGCGWNSSRVVEEDAVEEVDDGGKRAGGMEKAPTVMLFIVTSTRTSRRTTSGEEQEEDARQHRLIDPYTVLSLPSL